MAIKSACIAIILKANFINQNHLHKQINSEKYILAITNKNRGEHNFILWDFVFHIKQNKSGLCAIMIHKLSDGKQRASELECSLACLVVFNSSKNQIEIIYIVWLRLIYR